MQATGLLQQPLTEHAPTSSSLSSPSVPMTSGGAPNTQHSNTDTPTDEEGFRQNQVSTIILHGIPIVSLYIDGKERLCLAQISNTLLKEYSYNEIHNRRVALGITCVQCTPVQLEVLRRAGAMPISSRRCGMITKREAERLVKSFLEEHIPPKLPDNFAFRVKHSCGWGCVGQFIPSRYNSSRAKCIKCTYCNLFFSPNKFIFHFHRAPDASYRHPDAANFNSWRRHLLLDYDNNSDDLVHAWEDVKAMFNGGSRKRVMGSSSPGGCGKMFQEDDEDVYTAPKRQCFPLDSNDLPFSRKPAIAAASNPYPFMSLPNVGTPANMMLPFPLPPPPAHPMLPAPSSDKINKDAHAQTSSSSVVMETWKHRPPPISPMCHPLGLLWAKSFGMYPFSNHAMKFYNPTGNPAATGNRESRVLPGFGTSGSGIDCDERMSAFKPVNMVGMGAFSDSIHNTTVRENTASNFWSLPKCTSNNGLSNNNIEDLSFEATVQSKTPRFESDAIGRNIITDEISSVTDSEVCIEDIAVASPPSIPVEEEYEFKQENIKDEETHPKQNTLFTEQLSDRPGKEGRTTEPAADQSEPTTVYEMSKEELQRELIRMMHHRKSP